ncbi:hypothetical protein INT47_013079 [Mucor saturninus]|uniref:rRNA-processing protein FYV7 n=1 Tax=Mucor saturninus TaxID=64648 RepID=A0A8H7V3X8_9FUNG|nr:hypothetical protein INT47_013079 [Mucor saturninus]
MPPKTQPKKPRKPLTPLQRKQQKRKYELIHKATVKSQYYKTLNKDAEAGEDTPDYVKEIFGTPERTIDKDGNVVELERENVEEEDQVFDLDEESSSEEEEDEKDDNEETQRLNKRQKRLEAMTRLPKPNPFKTQLQVREKRKLDSQQEKEERQKSFKEAKKARVEYYKGRSEERTKMLAKTKKGQPKMASQMDVLLGKIQKSMN